MIVAIWSASTSQPPRITAIFSESAIMVNRCVKQQLFSTVHGLCLVLLCLHLSLMVNSLRLFIYKSATKDERIDGLVKITNSNSAGKPKAITLLISCSRWSSVPLGLMSHQHHCKEVAHGEWAALTSSDTDKHTRQTGDWFKTFRFCVCNSVFCNKFPHRVAYICLL